MELAQGSCQSYEFLAGGVVQVPRDFPPFLVLQAQELAGKTPQLLFGLFSIFWGIESSFS